MSWRPRLPEPRLAFSALLFAPASVWAVISPAEWVRKWETRLRLQAEG